MHMRWFLLASLLGCGSTHSRAGLDAGASDARTGQGDGDDGGGGGGQPAMDAGEPGPGDAGGGGQDGDASSGEPTCFAAGTAIAVPGGSRPIESLRVGDEVWAFDHALGRRVARRILDVHRHAAPVGRLMLEDGSSLAVTAEHPIYDASRGEYVRADGFGEAAQVLMMGGAGGTARVSSVGFEPARAQPQPVYNLSVQAPNNYFAGGLLVHNKPPIM